ncbi:MAG: thioredoxin family protein [Rikenellaceae bacterium]
MNRIIFSLLSLLLSVPSLFAQVQWSEPKIEPSGDQTFTVSTTVTIDEGWHIYGTDMDKNGPTPTSVKFDLPAGVELVGGVVSSQEPTSYYDDIFEMKISYFEGVVIFAQEIKVVGPTTEKIVISAEWMVCNDGSCMPPTEQQFEVVIPLGSTSTASVWWGIVEAILWGFAALLTPCVFPMVPMTISYFMKGDKGGQWKASLYGLFIVALYTLPIGAIVLITYVLGGDAVMADIFNWLATHWLPNIIFFVLFMLFAASFFGAFDLTLPSGWVNRSDSRAEKGSVVGIFFLALTLVLVSFSCTGPIVGSVLISSTQGEFWMPIATIFAFSCAFALPFAIFAMFPTMLKTMPKSGGWLSSVKVVLGFLEIALGLKFLSVADQTYHWGLLDREVYLAIWIVVFGLLGLYLLGKIRFAHDTEVKTIGVGRLFASIAVFSFVVYMVPGMWGAPLRALSGYLPPIETQDFVMSQSSYAPPQPTPSQQVKYSDIMSKSFPNGLSGFYDLEQARDYAREVNKPLLIDFTGHGCVNCRAMEQNVWSNAEVNRLLREDYVVVALYMDDKHELPESEWVTTSSGRVLKSIGRVNSYIAMERYGVNAQPYYIIEGLEGEQLAPPRGYDLDVEAYIEFLELGKKNFDK